MGCSQIRGELKKKGKNNNICQTYDKHLVIITTTKKTKNLCIFFDNLANVDIG